MEASDQEWKSSVAKIIMTHENENAADSLRRKLERLERQKDDPFYISGSPSGIATPLGESRAFTPDGGKNSGKAVILIYWILILRNLRVTLDLNESLRQKSQLFVTRLFLQAQVLLLMITFQHQWLAWVFLVAETLSHHLTTFSAISRYKNFNLHFVSMRPDYKALI